MTRLMMNGGVPPDRSPCQAASGFAKKPNLPLWHSCSTASGFTEIPQRPQEEPA